jgi:hypothetical protein
LNYHAFQPIQQFRYTVGKNVTDSAMIIDAMDILHSGVVDGFCLVSSDSIREAGVFVMGIGEKKTPKAFVNACDLFVYTENLVEEKKALQKKRSPSSRTKKTSTEAVEPETETDKEEADPLPVLSQAFEMAVGQDGWARLDVMGNAIYQVDPGFDPRTYGHKQLSRMLNKLKDRFEMRTKDLDGQLIFYVRMKE